MTNREQTVENIVQEIRHALKEADIQGPYILMPHSISGVYSMYYANTYPDEVKAVMVSIRYCHKRLNILVKRPLQCLRIFDIWRRREFFADCRGWQLL